MGTSSQGKMTLDISLPQSINTRDKDRSLNNLTPEWNQTNSVIPILLKCRRLPLSWYVGYATSIIIIQYFHFAYRSLQFNILSRSHCRKPQHRSCSQWFRSLHAPRYAIHTSIKFNISVQIIELFYNCETTSVLVMSYTHAPACLHVRTLQKQNSCFNPAKGLYAHCWVVNLQLR